MNKNLHLLKFKIKIIQRFINFIQNLDYRLRMNNNFGKEKVGLSTMNKSSFRKLNSKNQNQKPKFLMYRVNSHHHQILFKLMNLS